MGGNGLVAQDPVQRRLAAIPAADVVGCSRFMRDDEVGTLAQLKTFRNEILDPKVAEYGGRIFKTTGDGVLVEFASAVDAVQQSVDVQQSMVQRNASVADALGARVFDLPIVPERVVRALCDADGVE